jgi:flagellar biosynthesis/type III secretory pathway ATPase
MKKEIQTIQNLIRYKESQKLLNVSEYFLKKDILLYSVTLLYEAMLAFLDEKIQNNSNCNKETDIYKNEIV